MAKKEENKPDDAVVISALRWGFVLGIIAALLAPDLIDWLFDVPEFMAGTSWKLRVFLGVVIGFSTFVARLQESQKNKDSHE